jgi:putative flippase GtrA
MTANAFAPDQAAACRGALQRPVLAELVRYFAASGCALAADTGLYGLALRLGASYQWGAVLGFSLGLVIAYLLSVRWAFDTRSVRDVRAEFALFALVGALGLVLTELCLWVAIDRLALHPMIGKLATAVVVFAFNFTLRKLILFSGFSAGRSA